MGRTARDTAASDAAPVALREDCCIRCRRALTGRLAFTLAREARCLRCALCYRPMLRRSALTSLVVGSALTAINHGPALITGRLMPALA